MTGVYLVEDLLKLRASPLICKPPNLPPIEEWMGSQEPTTKRPTTRGRQEDNTAQAESFQKRSTLDPSLRKSTTDPERIVLGPPRRSFASSNARTLGRTNINDPEDSHKDGVGRHERSKTGEDLENRFGERRSGQFSGANSRYGNRHEQDHEKQRRRQDEDDGEGRNKKDHIPRWAKDDKITEEVDENGNAKSGFRRDQQTRSRFEQSWLRSDRGTEDARRENDRSGWRRDRAKDGDWDTPGKGDADPEWMDEPDVTEPAQAHTQEDFQRWKERMKAAANGPAEKQDPPATVIATVGDGAKSTQGAVIPGITSPDLSANSMDKFFAKFNEKRVVPDEKTVSIKPATKSKFASLFGAPVESKPEPSAAPVPAPAPIVAAAPVTAIIPDNKPLLLSPEPTGSNNDADQAGFQRILEMLGKRETNVTTDANKPKANTPNNDNVRHERNQSPDLVALFKQSQPSQNVPPGFETMIDSRSQPPRHVPPPGFEPLIESRSQPPRHAPPTGLEGLVESRSPAEGHRRQATPNKDELLLNLLRQADITAKPTQQPQRDFSEQRYPPGLFTGTNQPSRNELRLTHDERPEADRQMPMQQRANARSLFDDPAISGLSYQDELGARQGLQRRPTNGFDDPYFDRLRQQEQKSMQPPPGMSRSPGQGPPGLEQLIPRMPPGWPAQAPSQHQPPRQGPPPGINVTRGIQPPFAGPQQGPIPPMQQQGQRPPPRKYTGDSNLPNYPPGIGPPPGFMGNGPVPGLGFPHNNAAGQGQNYGRYNMAAENQGPQQQGPPPNMGRAFMEMYGNVERGGLRGGNVGGVPLPPGFR